MYVLPKVGRQTHAGMNVTFSFDDLYWPLRSLRLISRFLFCLLKCKKERSNKQINQKVKRLKGPMLIKGVIFFMLCDLLYVPARRTGSIQGI